MPASNDDKLEQKHKDRVIRAKQQILRWVRAGSGWDTSNKRVVDDLYTQACNSRLVNVQSSGSTYTVLMGIFAYDTIVTMHTPLLKWVDSESNAGPVEVIANGQKQTIYTSKYCILFPSTVFPSAACTGTPVGCGCPDWHFRYHNDTNLNGYAMHGCKHMIAIKLALSKQFS